jgi:hypothetical protein
LFGIRSCQRNANSSLKVFNDVGDLCVFLFHQKKLSNARATIGRDMKRRVSAHYFPGVIWRIAARWIQNRLHQGLKGDQVGLVGNHSAINRRCRSSHTTPYRFLIDGEDDSNTVTLRQPTKRPKSPRVNNVQSIFRDGPTIS